MYIFSLATQQPRNWVINLQGLCTHLKYRIGHRHFYPDFGHVTVIKDVFCALKMLCQHSGFCVWKGARGIHRHSVSFISRYVVKVSIPPVFCVLKAKCVSCLSCILCFKVPTVSRSVAATGSLSAISDALCRHLLLSFYPPPIATLPQTTPQLVVLVSCLLVSVSFQMCPTWFSVSLLVFSVFPNVSNTQICSFVL